MQEEILIKKSRSGTTIHYFNTDINENNYSTSTVPAVLKLNFAKSDVPIELNTFDGVSLIKNSSTIIWERNGTKNWNSTEVRMDYTAGASIPNPNYVTGRTFSQTINAPISKLNTDVIKNNFVDSMNAQFTDGTTSYVFFEETLIDDLYANIKLEKTFDVLNTLNIYNKVTGEYSIRESTTGVVFGKLEAIQKISDSNGNRLRIPLRNVPVGVFVASTDFQTPNDLDKNGDRIRLNYIPLTSSKQDYASGYTSYYFNRESTSFDSEFLNKVPLDGINIHPTFSNVVYTNEHGEFILHNINTGPQILFFEVDLLKQGLTKDEVALNCFPYPPSYENISVDTIPHYFYRAIPIDVVPSWGDSYQTGYTEVNITANLDLRKWATYIFPPVTYNGLTIDSSDYRTISRAPLTVQVRDMSKYDISNASINGKDTPLNVYPSTKIQMVEIQNIVDKNSDQQWEWANEFSQIKDKATFYTHGFHGIKLPANIYDDEGYKTNKFGEPQTGNTYSRGVWLCGYQLKMFLTKERDLYRTTGMALISTDGNDTGWYSRDHFHCSLYGEIYTLSVEEPTENLSSLWGEGIRKRKFPYEKAWSKNYPEKYSIPKPPKIENFLRQDGSSYYYSNGIDSSPRRPYIESPKYADGDLISGNSWLDPGFYDGWGLSWASGTEQYTDFSTDVIGGEPSADGYKPDMYRYEPIGAGQYGQNQYFGCYANGYYNSIPDVGATSFVPNAERYQRIEAGYGYYLFPSSMPRIVPIPTGLNSLSIKQVDIISNPDVDKSGYSSVDDQSSGGWWNLIARVNHYNSYSVLNRGKNISMDLSKKKNPGIPDTLTNDKLNIYRIIEGSQRVPNDTRQQVVPTYTLFIIERMLFTSYKGGNLNKDSWLIPFIADAWETSEPFFKEGTGYFVTLEITNTSQEDTRYQAWDANIQGLSSGTLKPNESIVFYTGDYNAQGAIQTYFKGFNFRALGNTDFDEINNKFLKTSIKFKVNAVWPGYPDGVKQQVENLHIRNDCASSNCVFDATDSAENNIFYVDSVWKSVYMTYQKRDGDNGYPNSGDHTNYNGDVARINTMYFNPGKWTKMIEYEDGNTSSVTGDGGNYVDERWRNQRLNGGGSMAFYWSRSARSNPNGVWADPLMSVAVPGNWGEGETFWNTPACAMKNSG